MPSLPTTLENASASDGLMLVPVRQGSPWPALRELHAGMADMRRHGLAPQLTFVHTLADDGRLVDGQHPDAAAFVLGYRLANNN